MSWYTKCTGKDCKDKYECFRFRAQPSQNQSWFDAPPASNKKDCPHFMGIEPDDDVWPLSAAEKRMLSRKGRGRKKAGAKKS